MSAAKLAAGAQSTAETAELRKADGRAGQRNCGRTAEKLRNLSTVSLLAPSLAPAPTLVRPPVPEKPRKITPATPPAARGAGWPDHTPPSLTRGLPAHEQAVIDAALAILAMHARQPGAAVAAPCVVHEYLRLHLAGCGRERFCVMFFDAGLALLAFEVLFEGTRSHVSVHPREVVKRAVQLNAAAVILAHNHPSGAAEPSRDDVLLTQCLRTALAMVDVRVLDHVVIGWPGVFSFAERELLDPAPAPPLRPPQAAKKREARAAVSSAVA